MKKILILAAIAIGITANAQVNTGFPVQYLTANGGTEWQIPSNKVDTVVKSTTYFWAIPATSTNMNQDISYTVAVDSIGGTPDMTFTSYVSNDGVHWGGAGTPIVFNAGKKYWSTSTTVPGIADSCVTVNTNPWTAKFFGIKCVVNSNTQRAIYHIVVVAKSTY